MAFISDRELMNLLVCDMSKKIDDLERHLQHKEDVISDLRESLERTRHENVSVITQCPEDRFSLFVVLFYDTTGRSNASA